MIIIKLHCEIFNYNDKIYDTKPVYINAESIQEFNRFYKETEVNMYHRTINVVETPEEILQLIRDEEARIRI